jgi:hypothetical protein
MKTQLTIEDINDMSELDELLIHTISDYTKNLASSDLITEEETEEPEFVNFLEDEESSQWIYFNMPQLKSFFGEDHAGNIRNFSKAKAPWIKKSHKLGSYLLNRDFVESAITPEEVKTIEHGGLLTFPSPMTTSNINKRLKEQGVNFSLKPKPCRKNNGIGASIWKFSGVGKRQRYLINVRDLRDSHPVLYKTIKRSLKSMF